MVGSVLSNLGILLLMHMIINTSYHFHSEKKIPDKLMPVIHVLVASWAIITMYYFPININGHLYDLRLIPLMFNALYHGRNHVFSIMIITSIWRLLLGGNHTDHIIFEVLVSNIIPPLLALRFYPLYTKPIDYKVITLFTVSWMISDISLILFAQDAFYTFVTIAPFRYFSLMISALIMHLIIARGRNLLEMTNKLQYYAERDPLTGLYNMRKFDELSKTFFPTSKKVFIAMIDVDCFKKINDSFGHKIGDSIIRSIAKILRKQCNEKCIAARYGGDEFIFLIEAEDQDKAYEILDIIRIEVASSTLLPKNSTPHLKVSLSIGLAELNDIIEINYAIEKADKLLYLAKQQGKNKICG